MDDLTSAVTLVTLDDPYLAEAWFTTICQTYDEVSESEDVWREFADRFPDAAGSSFGSGTAVAWVEGMEQLTTDPAGLLAELAARRDELPSYYWAEVQETEAAESYGGTEEATEEDPFGWVYEQPELVARVEATLQYLPEHYPTHLGPYLEQVWGVGWEQHPAEHKQAWLDQLLAGLETPAAEEPAAEEQPAEEQPAEEQPAEAQPGEAAAEVELGEVERDVADALAEALAEVPEAAALSDEEIAEVLAEVLAEQSAASESV